MRRVGAVALALVLGVVPVAAAGWMGKGSFEPDTSHDATGGWMTLDPETSSSQLVRHVYFNGFHGDYDGSLNPNVATLGTNVYHASSYSFYAMLGVWKDCNRDGYVGLGEQGQWEYRTELLGLVADAATCPPEQTPIVVQTGRPPINWFPSHNDGQWVREWLPIAWKSWNDALGDNNPYDVNDNGSRAWVDYGLLAQVQEPSLNCWFFPHPTGTYHSTGAFIEWLDCYDGHRFTDTWNAAVAAANGDNLGAGQLSFEDHPYDQHNSDSQLNQRNPWGETSDESYVRVWNCEAGKTKVATEPIDTPGEFEAGGQTVPSPIGSQHVNAITVVNLSQPRTSAPSPNSAGSIAGTFNETGQGIEECDHQSGNAANSAGNAPYALESDVLQRPFKVQPSATLTPRRADRPAAPFAAVPGLGKAVPPDGGTRLESSDGLWTESISRDEIIFLDSRFEPTFRWYNTYYAFVSPAAVSAYGLTLPKGTATGTYGFEACGTTMTGIQSGWECDPDNWWKDANGDDIEPRSTGLTPSPGVGVSARPGSLYNLRDVDCYDQNVGAARDLDVGPTSLTGTPCEGA